MNEDGLKVEGDYIVLVDELFENVDKLMMFYLVYMYIMKIVENFIVCELFVLIF